MVAEEVKDLDLDDLIAAAAYMRELNGPAAEPIAQIFDGLASGLSPDGIDAAILTAARAVIGRAPDNPSAKAIAAALRHLDARHGPVQANTYVDSATRAAIDTVLRHFTILMTNPDGPPSGPTLLAARHLDATEGPVRVGALVDTATRSAITTVLRYVTAAGLNRRSEGARMVTEPKHVTFGGLS